MEKKLNNLIDKALSRRSFIAGAGTAAATTILVGCSGSTTPTPTPTPPPTPAPSSLTDADYLNFALNLEYLEAEFYLRAATGNGLTSADTGNSTSLTVGGTQLPSLTADQKSYVYEIAQNELDHVRFLRSALGSAAVSAPAIDLTNSFNSLAMAAGITSAGFSPFGSYQAFLVGAFVFEDVGVTAYHGAAGLLTDKGNLSAAASILAVEGYHAAEVRTLLIYDSVDRAVSTATSVTPDNTYVNYAIKVSTLRATLGGGNETTLTALPPYTLPFDPTKYMPVSTIVAADTTNSIAFARTTDQVLHIVYAAATGAGLGKGGFFPSGLNGNIKVTAS